MDSGYCGFQQKDVNSFFASFIRLTCNILWHEVGTIIYTLCQNMDAFMVECVCMFRLNITHKMIDGITKRGMERCICTLLHTKDILMYHDASTSGSWGNHGIFTLAMRGARNGSPTTSVTWCANEPGPERALYLNVASREMQTQQAVPPPFDGPCRYLEGGAPQLLNLAYNFGKQL